MANPDFGRLAAASSAAALNLQMLRASIAKDFMSVFMEYALDAGDMVDGKVAVDDQGAAVAAVAAADELLIALGMVNRR